MKLPGLFVLTPVGLARSLPRAKKLEGTALVAALLSVYYYPQILCRPRKLESRLADETSYILVAATLSVWGRFSTCSGDFIAARDRWSRARNPCQFPRATTPNHSANVAT